MGLVCVLRDTLKEGFVSRWRYPIITSYRGLLLGKISACNLFGYSGREIAGRGEDHLVGGVCATAETSDFFKVVLLQVIKRIMAPMSNEIITLVKDTSLARVIGIYEIIWAGESFIKKGLIWPLFFTGVFYLVFSGGLTILFSYLEKKLDYFRG